MKADLWRPIASGLYSVKFSGVFPTARPPVMHLERTFWEKVTAIHVFCLQERLRGGRFARRWHDVTRSWRAVRRSLSAPIVVKVGKLNGSLESSPKKAKQESNFSDNSCALAVSGARWDKNCQMRRGGGNEGV